jgi:putative membrane protein
MVPSHGYSAIMGIFLVVLGTLISALAFVRYKNVKKQIDQDTWHHTSKLNALLTLAVFATGVSLIVYLIYYH